MNQDILDQLKSNQLYLIEYRTFFSIKNRIGYFIGVNDSLDLVFADDPGESINSYNSFDLNLKNIIALIPIRNEIDGLKKINKKYD